MAVRKEKSPPPVYTSFIDAVKDRESNDDLPAEGNQNSHSVRMEGKTENLPVRKGISEARYSSKATVSFTLKIPTEMVDDLKIYQKIADVKSMNKLVESVIENLLMENSDKIDKYKRLIGSIND